jgi:hypothetical protein
MFNITWKHYDDMKYLVYCLSGGMKYWRSEQKQTEPREVYCHSVTASADVEMTSYALLSMLQSQTSDESDIHNEAQIVRWLTTQRNAYGGFSSTQVFSLSSRSSLRGSWFSHL